MTSTHTGSSDLRLLAKFLVLFVMASLTLCYFLTQLPTQHLTRRPQESSRQLWHQHQQGTSQPSSELQETESSSLYPNACETIHLAFVCARFNSTRSFYVVLKSILFYRKNPLHLHILVDSISKPIIKTLLSTWNVEELQFDLYDIQKHEQQVSWIPNTHYSGNYGLLKLILPTILYQEKSVEKIVVLDTDILVLSDIAELWNQFELMYSHNSVSKKHSESTAAGPLFAMSDNQSDWYLKFPFKRKIWPAFKRGYNTGVILMDLKAMNESKWTELWRSVTEMELTTMLSTSLADQDIFNAIIRRHPSSVMTLPCEWNVQLNENSKHRELCPVSLTNYKIIHMNSPRKFDSSFIDTNNNDVNYLHNLYLTFFGFCGSLLNKAPLKCGTYKPQGDNDNSTFVTANYWFESGRVCENIEPKPGTNLRTFLYFFEFSYVPKEIDVTLAVQLSFDRVQVFEQLASRWNGPISAAIYLSDMETDSLMQYLKASSTFSWRKDIAFHLIFKENGFNYPINKLRNIAMNEALTSHIFVIDVDFLPSLNMYDYLRNFISDSMNDSDDFNASNKRLYVAPAFETSSYKFDFPTSKADLIAQLDLGTVSRFREQVWPKGQNKTDYVKWRAASIAYKIEWEPDYEPFVMSASENSESFDERFVGFGWNKVSRSTLLAAQGFEFWVLPNAFIIHIPHAPSFDLTQFRISPKYRACIKHLRATLMAELLDRHFSFFQTHFNTSLVTTTEVVLNLTNLTVE